MLATFSPSRSVMPRCRMKYWKASPISWSRNRRMRLRPSTSVTRTPSVAMMQAYSAPMTPPPTTIIVLGSELRFRISSLVRIVCSLNGTCAGRAGLVPTATRN